jgi:hypothetical protein
VEKGKENKTRLAEIRKRKKEKQTYWGKRRQRKPSCGVGEEKEERKKMSGFGACSP